VGAINTHKEAMEIYQGKNCIITGGASGIGAELCRQLASYGANVIVADLNGEGAKAIATEIGAEAVMLDVTNEEAVRTLVESTAQRLHRLDYIFNNAGIGSLGEIRDTPLAQWKRVLDINLYGVLYGALAAYPIMLQQGSGHIVNTASGYGLTPGVGVGPYVTSKFAVVGFSEALRMEAASFGVSVSTICPGFVRTAILDARPEDRIDAVEMLRRIPVATITAQDAAYRALRGVAKKQAIIAFPGYVKVLTGLYRFAPYLFTLFQKKTLEKMRELRITAPE
jgi:NAD(P)-dependent dehydrogenase (short-subunit alcohol dehydrogenase family)